MVPLTGLELLLIIKCSCEDRGPGQWPVVVDWFLITGIIDYIIFNQHGKLMVGDQLMEINNQSLSGLSSDEALMKLKNIIKEAQESEDGMVHVAVQRKLNMARSSSLNTVIQFSMVLCQFDLNFIHIIELIVKSIFNILLY